MAGIVELSVTQALGLLEDRLDGNGPCEVAESLDWATVSATPILPGARLLMAEIGEEGAKLTGQGYLNRRLVETLMDGAPWPEDEFELRGICKVFNEYDFKPANFLHPVLRVARLARHEKGRLKLTRNGKALLPEAKAGLLYARLLQATFGGYNLSYLDAGARPDPFGAQIGLVLFLIGQFCTDWRPSDELMRSVTLNIEEFVDREGSFAHFLFELRVLRYLCWFGLLEEKREQRWRASASPSHFRKTPLYDRALRFTLW